MWRWLLAALLVAGCAPAPPPEHAAHLYHIATPGGGSQVYVFCHESTAVYVSRIGGLATALGGCELVHDAPERLWIPRWR